MAYNFGAQTNNSVPTNFNGINQQMVPITQQNIQPLFPQPQGNVYNINSTLEVANVPVSGGMSVALCLNEGFMYIKTLQNGAPIFLAYKITPFENTTKPNEEIRYATSTAPDDTDVLEKFHDYENKLQKMQEEIESLKEFLSKPKTSIKKEDDWNV